MLILSNVTDVNVWFEFIISIGTIVGVFFAAWRMITRPIRHISEKMGRFESALSDINTKVIPVINSLHGEFSKNGGKSLMDRILRIDDNTRLAELRSKLIASNLMATAIFEFDKSGNLTWANKSFINMTGLDIDLLMGNGWFVAIEESSRARVWELWRHSIVSGIPFESEFIIKHQTENRETPVKCTIYPHKSVEIGSDGRNMVLGYYGTLD